MLCFLLSLCAYYETPMPYLASVISGGKKKKKNSLSLMIIIRTTTCLIFFSNLQDSGLFMGEALGMHSPAHPSDPSCPSAKAGVSGGPGEELDLSFLPDDLSTPVHSTGLPSSPLKVILPGGRKVTWLEAGGRGL